MPHTTTAARRLARFFISLMILITSLGCGAQTRCESNKILGEFVAEKYPKDIIFNVFRNGKQVGEHTTRFTSNTNNLTVESRMVLNIKVLFLTVYEFEYLSVANWCGEQLTRLDASTNRNGDISNVMAVSSGQGLQLTSSLGLTTAPLEIIPTDHWNPAVLSEKTVLNTITGGLNHVSINRCEAGNVTIEKAAPGSMCYQYSGELQTRVWYDEKGRWQGLEFDGDDGSTITYVCQRCS